MCHTLSSKGTQKLCIHKPFSVTQLAWHLSYNQSSSTSCIVTHLIPNTSMWLGIACWEMKCVQKKRKKRYLITWQCFSARVLKVFTSCTDECLHFGRCTTGHKSGKIQSTTKKETGGGAYHSYWNNSAICHMVLSLMPWHMAAEGCCVGLCLWAPHGHSWWSAILTVHFILALPCQSIFISFQMHTSVYSL